MVRVMSTNKQKKLYLYWENGFIRPPFWLRCLNILMPFIKQDINSKFNRNSLVWMNVTFWHHSLFFSNSNRATCRPRNWLKIWKVYSDLKKEASSALFGCLQCEDYAKFNYYFKWTLWHNLCPYRICLMLVWGWGRFWAVMLNLKVFDMTYKS